MKHSLFFQPAICILAVFACNISLADRPDPAESREIVVYSRGFAEIREVRTIEIEKGVGEVLLPMLSESTYGSSITIGILSPSSGVETLSAAYAFELIDEDNIWENRLGETVELGLEDSVITGTLLRATPGKLFLKTEENPDKITMIDASDIDDPMLDMLPGHLVTEPSIRWTYRSKKNRTVKLQLSYMVNNFNWNAEYRVTIEGNQAGLEGKAVVENESGLNFHYDSMILVAGEIHLAGDKRSVDRLNPKPGAAGSSPQSQFGDVRRWVMEEPGRLYTGHETVLHLLSVDELEVNKRYVYDATIFNDRVTTHLEFTLTAVNTTPLPAGNVRLYRKDGETIFLVGEDSIDDTPSGSPLDLTVAQAFDITAERVREREEPMPDGGTSQRFSVTLGNSGPEDVTVEVFERMFGAWSVENVTLDGIALDHEIKDARTARFDLQLPRGRTVKLGYDIIYRR